MLFDISMVVDMIIFVVGVILGLLLYYFGDVVAVFEDLLL